MHRDEVLVVTIVTLRSRPIYRVRGTIITTQVMLFTRLSMKPKES